ncbi:MAG: lamin tail domain-containing protein [Verrucomicrobiales bacterium]|nr:lamin tail domain-containing protein [Verrucomicrobiales bacterium]
MRCALAVLLFCSVWCPVVTSADPLVISEFMASNQTGLKDEDGEFSDWIELQNITTNAVNTAGWSLSDSAGNLRKWLLPATNIPPRGFLVVFASSKNRALPGRPLHTNFKLDAGAPGEFLGLVKPDGLTVASQYSPAYPAQFPDVSYGLAPSVITLPLIPAGATAKVRVPANEAEGLAWTTRGFDDASWTSGTAAFGYDTGVPDSAEDSAASFVLASDPLAFFRLNESAGSSARNDGNLGAAANGLYSGTAAPGAAGPRGPSFSGFEASNMAFRPGSAGNLRIPANPAFNFGTGPFTVEMWFLTTNPTPRGDLFTYKGAGGDFGIQLSAQAARRISVFHNTYLGNGGTVATNQWQHLVVTRDSSRALRGFLNGVRIINATHNGDLSFGTDLIFGSNHSGDPGSPTTTFNGLMDEIAIYGRAFSTNEVLAHYQGAQTFVPVSFASQITTDLRSQLFGVNASAYFRFPFTAADVGGIDRLKLRVRYDDGFVAYLNGVEVASANAPISNIWNSAATDRHADSLALQLEEFDLNSVRGLLVEGVNVLAIQGLNVAADNSDFFLQPQLEATEIGDLSQQARYFPVPSPGAANSSAAAELGPVISSPSHRPLQPRNEEDLVVTARISPVGTALGPILLSYRVMYGVTNTLPMLDDGLHGDGAAGDGVFGATIPAAASTNGQMVRWFISASDLAGRASRWPLFDDPTGSPEYLGTVVFNTGITSTIPTWEWFTPNETGSRSRNGARGSLFYQGRFYDNVFIRERGGATTLGSQKFDFNRGDEFQLDESYGGIREANLNSNGSDPSFIRPLLAFETFRRVGVPACLSFNVLMRVNNKQDRVAVWVEQVDQRFLERNGLDPEGALYKMVQRGSLDPVFNDSTDGVEKKTRQNESNADLQALVTGIRLNKTADERALYIFDNLNLPAMVNFLAVRSLIMDADDVRKNFYVYRDSNGTKEWSIFPWDKDWSFGVEGDGGQHLHHPFFGDRAHSKDNADQWNVLWTVLFNDPRPREMYLRRLRTLMDDLLQPPGTPSATGFFEQRVRSLSTNLSRPGPIPGNSDVLSYFPTRRNDLFSRYNVAGGGTPQNAVVPFEQPTSADISFGEIESFPASGNQDEEYVQLVNPNGFALDLSGWKVSGGIEFEFHPGTVIGPSETMYLSPNVAAFRARTTGPRGGQGLFVQGNYSRRLSARGESLQLTDRYGRLVAEAQSAVRPTVAQQHLRVTEIMYHPPAPPVNSAFTREDFEYIELTYTGSSPLALAGFQFTRGIQFDFTTSSIPVIPAASVSAPETLLLVKNRAAYESRYGSSARIAGQYEGLLDDSSEVLRLEEATGEVIAEFEYRDEWYPVTDGAGLALAANPAAGGAVTPSLKAYWIPTPIETHRPGTAQDPASPVIPAVFVNELLANPGSAGVDRVELYSPQGADISGWFLTDDLQDPKKYRVPNNTVIPPGGFWTAVEDQFNAGPNRFSFSSAGEEVYLVAANLAGAVLPWAHGYDFGASAPGVSFGRFLASTGDDSFVAQSTTSFGQANAGPQVGPVVVSEVMFHPVDLAGGLDNGVDEFVELSNLSSSAVALFDPAAATNRWEITGDIRFTFPLNTSLAAGKRLLLVNFDPLVSVSVATSFRQRFQVPADVPLYGPYGGRLDNSAGRISLRKPGQAATNGVPMILVDRVDYQDGGVWPAGADGTGASLQRLVESAFGDDASNWIVAAATAGQPLGSGTRPEISQFSAPLITAAAGTEVRLDVVSSGEGPLSYRWRFQGQPLAGATNASLQLTNLQAHRAGIYDVVVYNRNGSRVSPASEVVVENRVRILLSPQTVNTGPGTNVVFRVAALGTGGLRYRWLKDGVELPGNDSPSLLLPAVQMADAGSYSARVSDASGTVVDSSAALLRVLLKPVVVSAPQSVTAVVGENVTLTAGASGQPLPLVYRWRRGTSVFLTTTNNANQASIVLTNVQLSQAGRYSVIVTNLAGASTASAEAVLTVLPDTDADGLPNDWETAYGFAPGGPNESLEDTDQDGMNNRSEWLAGTHPRNASSVLRLRLEPLANGGQQLRFTAASNHSYTLRMRGDLSSASWNTISNVVAGTADRDLAMVDTYPGALTRYYQVVTPSLPDTRLAGPTLVQAPADLRVAPGSSSGFSVLATGQGVLRYQWYFENSLIPGATGSTFPLNAIQPAAAGVYRVTVSDQLGTKSASARLEVAAP